MESAPPGRRRTPGVPLSDRSDQEQTQRCGGFSSGVFGISKGWCPGHYTDQKDLGRSGPVLERTESSPANPDPQQSQGRRDSHPHRWNHRSQGQSRLGGKNVVGRPWILAPRAAAVAECAESSRVKPSQVETTQNTTDPFRCGRVPWTRVLLYCFATRVRISVGTIQRESQRIDIVARHLPCRNISSVFVAGNLHTFVFTRINY
mmetsp:Transcript_7358/g.21400  ORF Transcript_7358/g.21400 Transcript_7358/m.21400 type:complete len:204 (-) Transcript_7358:114-725(-)